jgi:protein-S-isoprenylcysteine O-methyltransferase Ste14
VRPSYTGIFISMRSFVLGSNSPVNLLMVSTIVALFMIKSIVEERFLRDDREYAAYLQHVHWH